MVRGSKAISASGFGLYAAEAQVYTQRMDMGTYASQEMGTGQPHSNNYEQDASVED